MEIKNIVWQNELEFLTQLRNDINTQIRSYAPMDKLDNELENNFKDSVEMLRWVRNKLKKRIDAIKERDK